ncbi:hypothetical protein LOC71_05355 [Rhodopirellula sp. JC740]|uniref:Uncharacterized protein n=1 Tax=Rhodopirellula halodulae TaxID=2894198 RepID=A0ABS8NDS1_9BACT|nr:hypothetical protein [Rhodopirellula sp. JC740]
MIESKNHDGEPSRNEQKNDSKNDSNKSLAKVFLQYDSELATNANHPLADIDPCNRAKQRVNVIASVLARLAASRSVSDS